MPLHVVFDNPPLEMDEWVREACEQTRLTLVDNKQIASAMAKHPEMRKTLLTPGLDPLKEPEKVAPLYSRILEETYADAPRRGLYTTPWIVYKQPVDAYILDWSEIERIAGTTDKTQSALFKKLNGDWLRARMKQYLQPGQILELPAGLTHGDKVKRAVEFIRLLD